MDIAMYYTIYKTTNMVNGKTYIGKHETKNPYDSYKGSGKAILNAMKKHGQGNFIKEVLYIFYNEKEMNNKEKQIVTEDFYSRSDTYNEGPGGEGGAHFKGKHHSAESKEKKRIAQLGRKATEETINKLRGHKRQVGEKNSQYGKPRSEETKLKIKNAWVKKRASISGSR